MGALDLLDGDNNVDVVVAVVAAALTWVLTTASSKKPIHKRSDTPRRDCCVRRKNGDAASMFLLGDSFISASTKSAMDG